VSEKFQREGLIWELQQVQEAARFRKEPSESELSSPAMEYKVWTTSVADRHAKSSTRTPMVTQGPILLLVVLISTCLGGISFVSLFLGAHARPLFLTSFIDFYEGLVRHALSVAYPVTWPQPPLAAFGFILLWSLFYIGYLVLNVFGEQEII